MKKNATMKQVAALAGVGTKTVSRVINGEPGVTPETARKVWDAVHALDYQVDMRAGSLRRINGQTKTLGLLISTVDNPFAGQIHRGVEDVASERGVAVLAVSLHEDPTHEVTAVEDFIRRRLDGKPLQDYHYRDLGSLVSLGKFSTVGNMMGGLAKGDLFIEGRFAKLMYTSLYKMHELAVPGWVKVALDTLARMITRRTEPHMKLH